MLCLLHFLKTWGSKNQINLFNNHGFAQFDTLGVCFFGKIWIRINDPGHLDHAASKEPINPLRERFSSSFDAS